MIATLPKRGAALAASLLCALLLPGCALVHLRQENRDYASATVLVGRVLPDARWHGPVSVAAIGHRDGKPVIEHEVWLHEPGGFELIVNDGAYTLVAYGDRDNDGRPDDHAPAGAITGTVKVASAGLISLLDIALSDGGREAVNDALPPNHHRKARISSAAGALADLDAPQFSAAAGKRAYWAPLESYRRTGGNIYFLEPYDPARTPVLFVHGATGSVQDWRYFARHLDRKRYQVWLYQYPSGAPLEAMAHLLYWKLLNLQIRHGFTRLELVAHSMGGLVTRRFLLDHGAKFPISQFVSISTPWGGQPMAAHGVSHSPAVVPSWRDLQPAGEFLQSLFAQPLPAGVTYTLLFGHRGDTGVVHAASDGTISVASQLRAEARASAALVMGFEESHAGILSSPEVVSEVERVFAADGSAASGGRLRVGARHPEGMAQPAGISTLVMRRLDADGDAAPRDESLVFSIAPTAAGADLRALDPGEYEVRLAAAPYRARPDRQRIRIVPGRRSEVSFRLEPDGVILGEVLSESNLVERPAGSFQRADNAIRVDSILLEGPNVRQELKPRRLTRSSLLEAYLDGRNEASNQQFCFVGLQAGEYTLTVRADGYETSVSRYTIVPGHLAPVAPVVMRKTTTRSRDVAARQVGRAIRQRDIDANQRRVSDK